MVGLLLLVIFVLLMNSFFVFNKFHDRSMTEKLRGPLAKWQVTKWPAIANRPRFVTPALQSDSCYHV